MENITLQDIAFIVSFIVGLLAGIGYIGSTLKKWIENALKEQFSEINNKLADLEEKAEKSDMEACKNFLVQCLDKLEKGDATGEIVKERFWEQYQHYIEMGGNSYIISKVENLQKDDLL